MTKAINKQFFPDYKPKEGESVLGKVTCYTCHQGRNHAQSTRSAIDDERTRFLFRRRPLRRLASAKRPGAEEAAVPDPRRPLQAHQPRPGGKGGDRARQDRRVRGDDGRGLQAGCEGTRLLVPHARIPRAVRRRDDDDQRQPAVHRRAEEEPARLRARRQGLHRRALRVAHLLRLSRSSARCSAATSIATCRRAPSRC